MSHVITRLQIFGGVFKTIAGRCYVVITFKTQFCELSDEIEGSNSREVFRSQVLVFSFFFLHPCLKPQSTCLCQVAYPYVAKRLLTDPDPALRERLLQVIYPTCQHWIFSILLFFCFLILILHLLEI